MKKNSLLMAAIFIAAIISITYYARSQEFKNRKPLEVFVPCGMTLPFKELGMAYEESHRGVKFEPVFDNANVLVKRILNKGRMPDLFVSPGKKEIGALIDKGIIDNASVKNFGSFELILIEPAKAGKVNSLEDLLKPDVKTIALANPDFNSVGMYAKEALVSLGYWDKIKGKVLFTNTPIEALSFIAMSKADAGMHYNACPFETDSGKVEQGAIKIIAQIPPTSHEPIYNYIGILKGAKNKPAAEDFINFIFSKKATDTLSKYGLVKKDENRKLQIQPAQTNAKIVIEAYYPFNEEHEFMKGFFEDFAKSYNGAVSAECIDFRSDEGYVRWRKTSLGCGGVLINGKNKFTINKDGQNKEVEFLKRMDMFWTKEDLKAAVDQELEAKK